MADVDDTAASDRDFVPGTFEYIEAKIRRDAEGNSYGGDFEWLCKWFLETAPLYRGRFEKVWLWKDWPGCWGPDCGIDLIARERTGELWAIQAKAHLPDNPVGKRKIDSFLSESSRSQIAVRLLMATTDRIGPNARRLINALANDDKPVQMLLRGQFLTAEVEWPHKIRGKGARLIPWTPKPYQETAIKAVVDGFRDHDHDRGRLIMACGTGKTLTAMWIAEALQSSLSLVLVPSLSLVEQNLDEWGRHAAQDFDTLVVCSDETIGNKKEDEDAAVQSVAQLGVKPTTDLKVIQHFLRQRRTRPAVVFATYQSSDCVAAAQAGRIKPFDLVICDEAHRLAGKTNGLFATVLDPKKIKARRRLFMTATPRIIKERDKRRFAEEGDEVVSMDDAHVFGPEFHRLWFSQAMDEGLLTDYKVIAIGVTDSEVSKVRAWVENAKLVRTADGLSTDARTLAAQIGLAKAMKKYDLRKLITFHSSIDRAARFVEAALPDSFTGILPHLSRSSRPSGKLWAKHISGKTPAGLRGTLLKGLKDLPDDTRGLLSNCRCLSEGVDVKALDGVAFIDPRRSVIDVIQAVGRVIRKPDNKDDKPFGYVIIPVLIDESEDADHALTKSAFDPIWQVLKALRSHDDRLASELDKLRLSLGKQSKTSGRIQLPDNIHLDLPTHLDLPDFEQAFYVRAVELTTTRQFRSFEEARNFVRALGLKNSAEWRQYCGGTLVGYDPKPEDIPARPDHGYREQGWINLKDWLGPGTYVRRRRQYRRFAEARTFVRSLGLKGQVEWSQYCGGELAGYDAKPDDIPARPDHGYREQGWINMGDWLGTGMIAPRFRLYRSFEDGRTFVRSLGLKSFAEWQQYCGGELVGFEPKPADIPAHPDRRYRNDGWVSVGDWLGTGTISVHKRRYRPFKKARAFVRSLGLRSNEEWKQYCKGALPNYEAKPDDIPSKPDHGYRDQGWISVGDWLGTGMIAARLRQYRSFEDARTFVRLLGLKSRAEWKQYCKGALPNYEAKPEDIPSKPDHGYRNQGWIGIGDWLGYG